ncbi:phage terminase large subunit [Mesorhizobium sp. B2-3-15]|uniref:phage terminase large subunit n=1 Tax=Mesorhizobium sp. B2-3-15 TaxID=2589949 RepID=UPI00112981E2|nr:phage terminase large subunit [Mesorhizobium sp. B2-3-15]TPL71623.1 hypothetical protein FJ954_18820 [Mesorhizobium sp. B2-3-15]
MTIVQNWDTALKGGRQHYYLLDLVRTRAAYPQLIQTVKRSIDDHDPDIVLIEDVGSGTSLIADLDHQGLSTTPVKSRMGKESRLSRVSAMMENGNVHLPKEAHWEHDFLEILAFPGRKHDDQVASMSRALILDEGRQAR